VDWWQPEIFPCVQRVPEGEQRFDQLDRSGGQLGGLGDLRGDPSVGHPGAGC
jgi:hypothetical protein